MYSSFYYSTGGVFFGFAKDCPDIPAKTILGIMVKCLFTKKKFLAKLIPCSNLESQFQYTAVKGVIDVLEQCDAKVLAVINDNNKVNTCYFKKFPGYTAEKPYVCYPFENEKSRPLFLLFDPVHLIKNIRNSFLTEKTKTLLYPSNILTLSSCTPPTHPDSSLCISTHNPPHPVEQDHTYSFAVETDIVSSAATEPISLCITTHNPPHPVETNIDSSAASEPIIWKKACWSDLRDLHKQDISRGFKMSTLTEASISPSSIQKQKVSLALQVFNEKTVTALRTGEKATQSWSETSDFLEMVVNLWKLLNNKSRYSSFNKRDFYRSVVDSTPSGQAVLAYLQQWANVASLMTHSGSQKKGEKRQKQLTHETGDALKETLNGLIELCKYLLSPASGPFQHQYVLLGFFQQDDLEHHFGHFRRAAGCNYYVSVRDVMLTHRIDRAKVMLAEDFELMDAKAVTSHQCEKCDQPLEQQDIDLLDNIAETEDICSFLKCDEDELNVLVYAAGYVAFRHKELAGNGSDIPSHLKKYVDDLNRGGLSYPKSAFLNYIFMAYAFLKNCSTKTESFCRKRLIKLLSLFPSLFHLDINPTPRAQIRVANIFLNNRSKQLKRQQKMSEASGKKSAKKRKLDKISSQ